MILCQTVDVVIDGPNRVCQRGDAYVTPLATRTRDVYVEMFLTEVHDPVEAA